MAIAVKPDAFNVAGAVVATLDAFQRHFHDGFIGFAYVVRHEAVREQEVARLVAECLDIERWPFNVRLDLPDRVNPPDKPPQPFQRLRPVDIRRASAAPFEDGKPITLEGMQRRAVDRARRDCGNFALAERADDRMLFENGGIGPTFRPIKLGDHRRPVFHADLIHAVFVAVEGEHAAVGAFAKRHQDAVERIEYTFGREIGEGRGGKIGVVAQGTGVLVWRARCIGMVRVHSSIVTRIAGGNISNARLYYQRVQCMSTLLLGRTSSPVSMRSSRKNGSVLSNSDVPGSSAYQATMAMSPRIRMTMPRAPCGTAIWTERTIEP